MAGEAPTTFALLDWIMARHVHEFFDAAGRPVGEGRAEAFARVTTEMAACPYTGGRHRHEKPMNVSALRLMPPWREVLTLLAWLAQRRRARTGTAIESYEDLAAVTGAGIFLADFLTLRRRDPVLSGSVPVVISGLYKVCLGFQLAYLPERFTTGPAPGQLPDGAGFLGYLEESGLLIGEAEACAGTPAMILQAFDAITSGETIAPESLPQGCRDLVIDWDRFDGFACDAGTIWRDLTIFAVAMRKFRPELSGLGLPGDARDRLNALLDERVEWVLSGQSGLVVEIARAMPDAPDEPDGDAPPDDRDEAHEADPEGLAAAVSGWLDRMAPAEMLAHGQVVRAELTEQLGLFDGGSSCVPG